MVGGDIAETPQAGTSRQSVALRVRQTTLRVQTTPQCSHELPENGISPITSYRNQKATPKKGIAFWWWEEVDSNYRSRRRQIYSLIHLATLESSRI